MTFTVRQLTYAFIPCHYTTNVKYCVLLTITYECSQLQCTPQLYDKISFQLCIAITKIEERKNNVGLLNNEFPYYVTLPAKHEKVGGRTNECER